MILKKKQLTNKKANAHSSNYSRWPTSLRVTFAQLQYNLYTPAEPTTAHEKEVKAMTKFDIYFTETVLSVENQSPRTLCSWSSAELYTDEIWILTIGIQTANLTRPTTLKLGSWVWDHCQNTKSKLLNLFDTSVIVLGLIIRSEFYQAIRSEFQVFGVINSISKRWSNLNKIFSR